MNAKELYQAGQLDNAIEAITAEVKKHPTDSGRRGFLCELLMVRRAWERADKQLDFIAHQDPNAMGGVALWRQVIRASQAREQFFTEGRVPEVLEVPDELVQTYLKASVSLRENDKAQALSLLEEAENMRPQLKGEMDGQAFSDFRDLDDVAPGVLEVLTSTGKYYWIPFSRVVCISFHKPESPLDLVFRRATLEINHDGPDGEVYIPAIYHNLPDEDQQNLLLGRATDWVGQEGEPIMGIGQRMFLMDEQSKSIMEVEEISFDQD